MIAPALGLRVYLATQPCTCAKGWIAAVQVQNVLAANGLLQIARDDHEPHAHLEECAQTVGSFSITRSQFCRPQPPLASLRRTCSKIHLAFASVRQQVAPNQRVLVCGRSAPFFVRVFPVWRNWGIGNTLWRASVKFPSKGKIRYWGEFSSSFSCGGSGANASKVVMHGHYRNSKLRILRRRQVLIK